MSNISRLQTRIGFEKDLTRKYAAALINEGFFLRVHDGDAFACGFTKELETVCASLMLCDREELLVYRSIDAVSPIGWLVFIYGNDGYDVLSDYSTNLERFLAPVNCYADGLQS